MRRHESWATYHVAESDLPLAPTNVNKVSEDVKQIEEMAKVIHSTWIPINHGNVTVGDRRIREDDALRVAHDLYNAGCRKQEWISVDERLPETQDRVLVYLVLNAINHVYETMMDTDRVVGGRWVRWGTSVSHWMPLPEAPKMKGENK